MGRPRKRPNSSAARSRKAMSSTPGPLVASATLTAVTVPIFSLPLSTDGSGLVPLQESHPPTPPKDGEVDGLVVVVAEQPSPTTVNSARLALMRPALPSSTTSTMTELYGMMLPVTTSNPGSVRTPKSFSDLLALHTPRLRSHKMLLMTHLVYIPRIDVLQWSL